MADDTDTGLFGLGGTGFTSAGIQGTLGGIGGVVGGFMTAGSYRDEAGQYRLGADEAFNQANTAETIGRLQQFATARKIALTESSSRAAIARNGLQEAGSAADIMRESVTQGAQMQQAIAYSTELKADQFREQGYSAQAQGRAADNAAFGAEIGGVLKGVSAVASLGMMF